MTLTPLVESRIRRSNRYTLLAALAGTIVFVVGLITSLQFWSWASRGPTTMTAEEVISAANAGQSAYLQITGDVMLKGIGIETETENGTTKTIAYYSGLVIGERILPVKTKGEVDESRLEYVGSLVRIPSGIQRDILDATVSDNPELEGVFLPMMLESPLNTTSAQNGIGVLLFVALYCLGAWYFYISRSRNFLRHPIMRGLSGYGEPYAVLEKLNSEWIFDSKEWQYGFHFTRNWLIYLPKKGNTFEAVQYKDLMWLYEVSVKQYGILTTSRFIQAYDRYGRAIIFGGSNVFGRDEEPILNAMKEIILHAPWVIVGHNNQQKKLWEKKRAEFIAMVDERRRQIEAAAMR